MLASRSTCKLDPPDDSAGAEVARRGGFWLISCSLPLFLPLILGLELLKFQLACDDGIICLLALLLGLLNGLFHLRGTLLTESSLVFEAFCQCVVHRTDLGSANARLCVLGIGFGCCRTCGL